jgi:hypothetical protein
LINTPIEYKHKITIKTMCFEWFKKWSLQTQIILGYVSMVVLVCVILFTIGVGQVVSVSLSTHLVSQQNVMGQIQRNAKVAITETSDNVQTVLNNSDTAFLSLAYQGIVDIFEKTDYSVPNPNVTYYNNDNSFLSDLSNELRYGIELIALDHSSIFIPGFLPTGGNVLSLATEPENKDIVFKSAKIDPIFRSIFKNNKQFVAVFKDGAEPENKDIVFKSAKIDPIFRSIFKNNKQFVAVYMGFSENGAFRHYPGINTNKAGMDPGRTYDPTKRAWYQSAVLAGGTVIITDPYLDAFGKGWMVSIARAVYIGSLKTLLGVISWKIV